MTNQYTFYSQNLELADGSQLYFKLLSLIGIPTRILEEFRKIPTL